MVYDNSTYIILNPIGEPCLWITWGYTPRVRDLLLEPRIFSPRKNKQPRGFFLLHIWYIMIHLYRNDISFGAFLSHVPQNHPKLEWSIYIKQYQTGRSNAFGAIPMTFQMETSTARDLRDVGALVPCSLLNHLGSSPETARPVTRTEPWAGPPLVFFRMKIQWENTYIYLCIYIYNKLGFLYIPKWSSNFEWKLNI